MVFIQSNQLFVFSELLLKTIKQNNGKECNICYSKDIYRNLIKELILLENNKRSAVVGHHFTIGYKDNEFDIHDTYYEINKLNDYIYFTKNIYRSFYKFYENINEIKLEEKYKENDMNFEYDNQNLWNNIRCYYKNLKGGAPKLKLSLPTKPKVKQNRREIEDKQLLKTSKDYANNIKEKLKEAYATKYKNMLVKIPNIPNTIQVRVIKLIIKHNKTKNNRVVIILDKNASYISINIL